jgi:hypothetical protein
MMRKRILVFPVVMVCLLIPGAYGQQNTASPLKFTESLMTGYNRGFGIQGSVIASNFDKGFPFSLRLGMGLNILNPGNALDARRIFVNNATNGTPEKKGHSIDFRLDFMIPKTVFGVEDSYFAFGPRFSAFQGDFRYVGGNEDFEVRSNQWGIGAELGNHFKMMKDIVLVINYGLDFYFPSTLSGHDSSYSPDNDNINPKDDYQNDDQAFKYRDADKAIYQPKFMPHLMLGLIFSI